MDSSILLRALPSWDRVFQGLLLLLALFCVFLVSVSFYRLTLHPLAKYPGPISYKLSSYPLLSQCGKGNRHIQNYYDHQKYGPVVRVTPNTLSFSSVEALHAIYGSKSLNVKKSDFYLILDSGPGGSSTHTEMDKEKHAARRRVLSHAFSSEAVRAAESFIQENVKRFIELIGPESEAAEGEYAVSAADAGPGSGKDGWSVTRDMSHWTNWLAFDIMGDLAFGKRFDCLGGGPQRGMPAMGTEGTKFGYWLSYIPFAWMLQPFMLTDFGQWLGGETAANQAAMVSNAIQQFDERAALEEQSKKPGSGVATRKDSMHWLLNCADPKTGDKPTTAELRSDALLLIAAGADTIATNISAVLFYLLRDPSTLHRATSEIRTAFESSDDIRTGPALESCSYLAACIEEGLRLAPPVAASLPRVAMRGGAPIDGHHVPEGTIVGVAAYTLHHDPHIFPDPFSFRPERWLVSPSANGRTDDGGGAIATDKKSVERARRAMLAFSVGSRGCVGKALAYVELKIALAHILWRYDMREAVGAGTGRRVGGGGKDLEVGLGKDGGLADAVGREREGQYQLYDCFAADRRGPLVEFRERGDVVESFEL